MNKFITGVALGLVLGLFVSCPINCGKDTNNLPKIDTLIIDNSKIIHDTIPGKPIVKKVIITKWDTIPQYKPDTNYLSLLLQYKKLGDSLFSKKYYSTTYKIDTFGTLTVNDTIYKNRLLNQCIVYDLKIPKKIIKVTERLPYIPKTQVYLGFGVLGNNFNILNGVETNLLLKTKKDKLYSIGVQKSLVNPEFNYKFNYYIKL